MRIYLDNCCYNRPFDSQAQVKVFLREGDAVIHKKYGRGTVIGVKESEDGSVERILVRLQDGGEKLFTALAFQGAMRVVDNSEE